MTSPLLAALLVWNAWALAGFLRRFFIAPPILYSAVRQYIVEPRFDAATFAANWELFLGAFACCAGVAALAGAAGRLLVRWTGRRPAPPLPLALGFGIMGSLGLGLGLAGLWIAPPRRVSIVLLALCAALAWRRRHAWIAAIRECLPDRAPVSTPVQVALLAVLALNLAGVLNIEMAWDALTYHLRIQSFYTYHHKIYAVWHHPWAAFPSLIEMVYGLGLLLHGDLLARMVNALFGLLLLGSLPGLARAARAESGLAAALVIASPAFLLLMGRAYIDLGFACFVTLGLRELLAWRAGSMAAAVTAGAAAGCGLASKYVGAMALLGYLGAAVVPPRPRRLVRPGLLWILAAAAPFTPWLAKNWLFTGNPVSPMLGNFFGTHEALPGDVTPLFSSAHPVDTFLSILPDRAMALLANAGRIDGPLVASVLGLFPLLALGLRDAGTRPLAACVLGYTLVWFVLAPDSRFFLPVLPAFAVVASRGLAGLRSRLAAGPRLGLRVLLEAQLVAGALYAASVLWVFFDPLGMPLGLASVTSRLQLGLPPPPFTYYMKSYVNAHVPPGDRIWYLSSLFTCYVERECVADFHFDTSHFARLARGAPTTGTMAKRFRQLGFRWLLSTGSGAAQYAGIPGYFDVPAGAWEAFKRLLATRGEAVWQTEQYTLYRLAPPHPPRPLPALPIFEAIHWEQADRDLGEGRVREALAAFMDPPPLLADVGSTFTRQGDAWMTLGDARRAEAAFRRALALGADQPRVRAGLAQALLRLDRPREALAHSEAGWAESPASAYAAAGLALNYYRLGRLIDARRLIREAIRLRPDEPDYRAIARQVGADQP